ncbi:uncharacterized protein BKCO1_5100064 [Diplodia corticola]|uniref:Uncharacterized protein n=1 Tax=Diplodia corticola TaxID=236234 RepID=A0A1J9QRT7_9PEZI|nr:uncharacterized protein BKCO1_5100064 [Diplodia corticola]OJD31168.1 hypothetical protein BKCO1_5100064 [Diplodia corticola]
MDDSPPPTYTETSRVPPFVAWLLNHCVSRLLRIDLFEAANSQTFSVSQETSMKVDAKHLDRFDQDVKVQEMESKKSQVTLFRMINTINQLPKVKQRATGLRADFEMGDDIAELVQGLHRKYVDLEQIRIANHRLQASSTHGQF